jgi:hypothetical protein
MRVQAASTFPHRLNQDTTYDSICPVCYLTVASSLVETDLTEHEALHACDTFRLHQLREHAPVFTTR